MIGSCMIKNEKRLICALALNVVILLLEAHSFFVSIFIKRNISASYFAYYTHISNAFAFIASILITSEIARELVNSKVRTRLVVRRIRYVSVCMQALTMVTVLFVLLPSDILKGTLELKSYANIEEYLLCPLLSIVSIIIFGDYRSLGVRDAIMAVIPTVVYAVVMVILNATGMYSGPYSFFRVRNQSFAASFLWTVLIIGGAFLISLSVIRLAGKNNQKYLPSEG